MRAALIISALACFALLLALPTFAQDAQHAVAIENLRSQLRDVQWKEADLKARLDQLNWDLKPENIERYFAGVGSTRPEELREGRRRLLQSEKDAILVQLDQLATSRQQLEAAILQAQTQALQQSSAGKTSLMVQRLWVSHRPLVITGIVLTGVLVGMLVAVPLVRRRVDRSKQR